MNSSKSQTAETASSNPCGAATANVKKSSKKLPVFLPAACLLNRNTLAMFVPFAENPQPKWFIGAKHTNKFDAKQKSRSPSGIFLFMYFIFQFHMANRLFRRIHKLRNNQGKQALPRQFCCGGRFCNKRKPEHLFPEFLLPLFQKLLHAE